MFRALQTELKGVDIRVSGGLKDSFDIFSGLRELKSSVKGNLYGLLTQLGGGILINKYTRKYV